MLTIEEKKARINAKLIGQIKQLWIMRNAETGDDMMHCEVDDDDSHWYVTLTRDAIMYTDQLDSEYTTVPYDEWIDSGEETFLSKVLRQLEITCCRKFFKGKSDETIIEFLDRCENMFVRDIDRNCVNAKRLKEIYLETGGLTSTFHYKDMKYEVWLQEFNIRMFEGGYELLSCPTYTDLEMMDDSEFLDKIVESMETALKEKKAKEDVQK